MSAQMILWKCGKSKIDMCPYLILLKSALCLFLCVYLTVDHINNLQMNVVILMECDKAEVPLHAGKALFFRPFVCLSASFFALYFIVG